MTRVLMVIAPQDFRDAEYLEPRRVLETAGVAVDVASVELGQATGVEGTKVTINYTIEDITPKAYQAVIFVGGSGMAKLVNNKRLISLALSFYQAGAIVAAICIAPVILANAGLLQGKKATSWMSASINLQNKGADYTGKEVEVDDRVITANGPHAAVEFGQKVLEMIKK